jgi:aryl-alcohol dehydrogenase-like predicted oxidoreductase
MTANLPTVCRLGLGTAQFGLDYGIANPHGRVESNEVARILKTAQASGISLLDTAHLYGQSEEVLGRLLPPDHPFWVVTKTVKCPSKELGRSQIKQVIDAFRLSLERLQQPSAYGLLIHDADDLLKPGGEDLGEMLLTLRALGLVSAVGVSVYTARQIEGVMNVFVPDIIQLPVNVLDQRLVHHGHLSHLHDAGVEIHARSAFLQGLLLMSPDQINGYFEPILGHLRSYHAALRETGLTPLQAALQFVLRQSEISHVIVGVCSEEQLKQIIAAASESSGSFDFARWHINEPRFIDPSLWQLIQPQPAS